MCFFWYEVKSICLLFWMENRFLKQKCPLKLVGNFFIALTDNDPSTLQAGFETLA